MMIEADVYIFDIDGTLLVTRDLVHWNGLHQAMLEIYGVDTTIAGLAYHGKTDVAILRAALARCGVSDQTFYAKLPSALSVICREVTANAAGLVTDVCPAIPQFLAQLRGRGKILGIASGNLEQVGWRKVAAARLQEYFTFGSFGDACEKRSAIFENAVSFARKIAGDGVGACFVGDTPDDIRAARSVNAKVIAVCTGTFSCEELAANSPDACCRSCADLLADPCSGKASDRADPPLAESKYT